MEPAVFFDGRSSRRRIVALAFGDRLEIRDAAAPDGELLGSWPYEAVRRVDGAAGALRLACTAAPPLARLDLRDPAAQAEVRRRCPALDGPGSSASVPIWRIVAWSLTAAAGIAGMVWFGIPLLADRLAMVMPYSWEKPLGGAVDSQVRRLFGLACAGPAGVAALHKLVDRLQTIAQLPIAPDPVVLHSGMANAFALPGGRVYVLAHLLTLTETPDELAGVLSHELGHVAHRDGIRRLIRDGGTSFLVGLMFGDVSGSGALLMAGRAVLSASYTRGDERRADAFAISVMRGLGRPTAPLGALLERIAGPSRDDAPALLSDHPLTPERKAMLEAENVAATGPPLLDETEWADLKRICER